MRPRSGEVQVRYVLTPVVRPEPCRLRQNWLYGKGTSEMGVQRISKVARINHALRDDVRRQVREIARFEIRHDRVEIRLRRAGPIGSAPKMRDLRQNIETVAAGRGEGRISRCRAVEIQREVLRQGVRREYLVEQS